MLSIIIPTYNEEKYLPSLLKSIEEQHFKDSEIIISDADSQDNTLKIARSFGSRIVKGGHPAKGRNNGALASKGEILLFLDSDIILEKNFLRDCLRQIKEDKLDVAGCYLKPIGNHLLDRIFFYIFNSWTFVTQFFYPNASGAAIFCKKKIFDKVFGFDENLKLSEDMDFVKRCGKISRFRLLNKRVLVSMRRFEKEGRLKVGSKLLMSAIYRLIFGEIRSDVFKYNLKYRK